MSRTYQTHSGPLVLGDLVTKELVPHARNPYEENVAIEHINHSIYVSVIVTGSY